MHPIILAIRARDKALRASGKQAGLWSVDEAAEVLQTGRSNIYALCDARRIEYTAYRARGSGKEVRRLTSAGMISFVEDNTTGPDDVMVCGNVMAVMRTLPVESLATLKTYLEDRLALLKKSGAKLEPRPMRNLTAALDGDWSAAQMNLFSEPEPATTDA